MVLEHDQEVTSHTPTIAQLYDDGIEVEVTGTCEASITIERPQEHIAIAVIDLHGSEGTIRQRIDLSTQGAEEALSAVIVGDPYFKAENEVNGQLSMVTNRGWAGRSYTLEEARIEAEFIIGRTTSREAP
jgi:hypothetical protein